MEQDQITVRDSISFRDAAMDLDRRGLAVYVRPADAEGPVFRLRTLRVWDRASISEIFGGEPHLPVDMETVASAMVKAREIGKDVPALVVFTYGDSAE